METDEQLETGYGPATAPGDNFCNDYAQGLAAAYSALAHARGDRIEAHDDLALTLSDSESPSEFGNIAIPGRPLSDDEWRTAAARMHAFYAQGAGGPFLVWSAWPTPDMTVDDFGRIGHPPLMLRLPGPVPPRAGHGVQATQAGHGLEIRPVTDSAGAEDWERTLVDGFPEPSLQPARPGCFLPERALAAPGWSHWVAYLDDHAVGTASAYRHVTHVDVAFIATLERARGRGIGRALTATAAITEPEMVAMLVASDLGRPVYERLGFRTLLRFTLWSGHRAA